MNNPQKEKRTKEEVIRLLDRAIRQEETLLEKVKDLEAALEECHKTVKNPRHEVEERALPASKISFRLDFYKTENKGSFKGIIEHLPSRESRTFAGTDIHQVDDFVAQFIQTAPGSQKDLTVDKVGKKKAKATQPEMVESPGEIKEQSPKLTKLLPEIFGAPAIIQQQPRFSTADSPPVHVGNIPFSVVIDEVVGNQRAIHLGQSFQIEIPMRELPIFQEKPCNLTLTAVSLEKKPHQTLSTFEICLPNRDKLQVPVTGFPLELGVYRLLVSMTLRDAPKMARYEEQRLLIVQ